MPWRSLISRVNFSHIYHPCSVTIIFNNSSYLLLSFERRSPQESHGSYLGRLSIPRQKVTYERSTDFKSFC